MKKIAFLFPGQGSQKLGMLSDFITQEPIVLSTFQEASDYLSFDLLALTQQGSVEALDLTEHAQPAILTASVALWRLWNTRTDCRPDVMMGHSLGEYSALVCSDVLSFQDAVQLVYRRGQHMQEAVPVGSGMMAALLKLTADQVIDLCSKVSAELQQIVAPANFNTPGQTVISGTVDAVEQVILASQAVGGRAKKLPVTVPSHCLLMQSAADRLQRDMRHLIFNNPSCKLIQNVSANIENNPNHIRDHLIAQLYSPVRWTDSIRSLFHLDIHQAYECGPGRILTGLNKRIEPMQIVMPIDQIDQFKAAILSTST